MSIPNQYLPPVIKPVPLRSSLLMGGHSASLVKLYLGVVGYILGLLVSLSVLGQKNEIANASLFTTTSKPTVILNFSATYNPIIKDTISLTFDDADSMFFNRNITLVANRYRIDAARANEIAAKAFANPNLYIEQSIYNQRSGRILPIGTDYQDGSQGQNIISVQQLVYLAGKRNKRLRIALEASNLSSFAFQDLCRTLKYELHAKLLDVHARQRYQVLYTASVANLRATIRLYKIQVAKGNLALKELVRLQAFLLALETEQRNLRLSLADLQADIRLLLGLNNSVWVNLSLQDNKQLIVSQSLDALQDIAQAQRPDLKMAAANLGIEEANKVLEKANAIPDLNLGAIYDRNGSYIQNYTGVSAQMALPVLNQNRGLIKVAELRAKAAFQDLVAARQNANQEVTTAYQKLLLNQQMSREQDPDLMRNFEGMMVGLTRSYQQQIISVVEYIDFYESYKNTYLQYYDLENDKLQAIEELNYATGQTIYKLK